MFTDSSCYANMPAQFKGKSVYLYDYDSYDITAWVDAKGKWTNDPYTGQPGYQLVYARDWTGGENTVIGQKNDSPNQLKYYRTMPPDRTILTWCNYHVTTAGADRCPVVFASGTAKSITYKHMAENGWDIASAPFAK